MRREGEVFEESEGPIEDILGGRKDKILYISRDAHLFLILFIYLFLCEPYRSNTEGGQGRQFDSSCDRPALPYSFFAPGGALKCATLTLPCHITAATLLPLHPYPSPFTSNQHTHFPSPPSLGFILRLLVTQRTVFTLSSSPPPSPGTLTKHTPPELPLSRFRHEAISPRSASSLSTIVLTWLATRNMPSSRHSFKRTLLPPISWDSGFFSAPVASPSSKIMYCGVEHVHCSRQPA